MVTSRPRLIRAASTTSTKATVNIHSLSTTATPAGNPNLIAALSLAAAGLPVFPAGPDKRPLLAGWQEKATSEEEQVRKWWDSYPAALPAIVVGRAGLVVIDCDRHPGGNDGIEAFNRLLSANGSNLADVPITKTANGGAHVFFRQLPGEPLGNGRGELPDGIDVRGAGGFVIAPGAVLPDGKRWQSVNGRPLLADAFKAGTIPEVPQWLTDIIRAKWKPNGDGIEYARSFADMRGANGIREHKYALAALSGCAIELARTAEGGRNEKLNKVAYHMGRMIVRGWIEEAPVIDAFLEACNRNSYLREHGRNGTVKTIRSGITAGHKAPHLDLPDREPSGGHGTPLSGLSDLSDLSDLSGSQSGKQKCNDEGHAKSRKVETGSWDEPDWTLLDDRRGELPDFPLEVLPASLRGWLLRTARGAGVTPGHVAVPFLGIASSLIGTARRVRASRSWSEPLTMWVAIIGFSGTGKTPGLDVTRRALSLIERERKYKIAELQREHETRAQKAKAEKKKWEQAVADAVEAGVPAPPKPEGATDPGPFVAPRLCVSDSTIERIAVLLEVRPRGMAFVADELARLFLNMRRYSSGQDNEFWLEAWNGKNFIVERQGRQAQFVEAALRLWRDYFWPHSRAALLQTGLTEKHTNARRALYWIRTNQKPEVSLLDIRREALGRRLDAEQTRTLLDGLVRAGWLKLVTTKTDGRAIHRWHVNPLLFSGALAPERPERSERGSLS